MTDRPCPLCSAKLAPGIALCGGCMQRCRNGLRSIPGLLAELELATAKLTSPGDGSGLGEAARLDFDPVAADAALAITTAVHGWVRVWDEETPVRPIRAAARARALASIPGQCGLLAGARLAGRPWVPELARDIRKVTEAGWVAVDLPPEVSFVGWCQTCPGRALYATEGATDVECRTCGGRFDVQASKDALLAAADGELAPASVLARALGIDPGLIRQWRRRERLVAADVDPAGRPLYRVSDVQRLRKSAS